MDNEELDIEIAVHVFGVSRDAVEAWPWPIPGFSSDRRWSAAVVTEMWSRNNSETKVFERKLRTLADACKLNGGLAELMVVNTPDEICKAAITAVQECAS
jgi:hypothetical protein